MGSMRLLRVFGIDVKVHSTFLLALGLGAIQWSGSGLQGALFGVLLIALLFVCVVLHELGHSVVANAFGLPVKEILLLPIGGVAQMTRRPTRPGQELAIAIVGPLVNVAISAGLGVAGYLWLGADGVQAAFSALSRSTPSARTLWVVLTTSNLALALFNLLPALPMDGGRVLRAILSLWFGPSRATAIAVGVARLLAGAMFVFALASGQLILGLISIFVFFGARAEAREEQLTFALSGLTAGELVNPKAPTFGPDTTLGAAVAALRWNPQAAFAVVQGDRLLGAVARRRLLEAARAQGPSGYLASVMERAIPTVAPTAPLSEVRQAMLSSGATEVAVVDGAGQLIGLLTEHELVQQASVADIFTRFGPRGGPRPVHP